MLYVSTVTIACSSACHESTQHRVTTDTACAVTANIDGAVLAAQPTQTDGTEAIVSRVLYDVNRRKKNVIVSGLNEATCSDESEKHARDITMFERLCEDHLAVKPAVSHLGCRRLDKLADYLNKPRKLLIHLNSEVAAASLLNSGKLLRLSDDAVVAANVFINLELSPAQKSL